MAKTMKPSDVKTAGGPTAEVIRRAINEARRHKDSAKTYSGYHSDVVGKFCDGTGIHRKAFNFARMLDGMEDDKRQAIIRDLGTMFRGLGFFDQGDLLHPVGMETVVGEDEIAAREAPASGPIFDDGDDETPKQRKAREAADRAEARKKPTAEVAPDAAARAATTAAELADAPAEVAESFTERMRRQNDGVEKSIRKSSADLNHEIDEAIGVH